MTNGPTWNCFGPNFPLSDIEATCKALGIKPGDRVLEVGGAGNAFARANVVCDLTFASCAQRNGAPGVFREDVTYVEAPAESLPFADGEFDFVWCTQVLEHVLDPEAAARELSRVAKRGFVEVPSRLGEMINGNPTHRWVVDHHEGELVFHPRRFCEHPFENFFYGPLLTRNLLRQRAEFDYRNVFNHQVVFEGQLLCRIAPGPKALQEAFPAFEYSSNTEAGRAHYDFARNALVNGAPIDYAYPDALEARHLLPDNDHAACLKAVYEAKLLRVEDALQTVSGLGGEQAKLLQGLLEQVQSGALRGTDELPIPPALAEASSLKDQDRPVVTCVVAGADPSALLRSVESALTQDWPAIEVVVATTAPPESMELFNRLQMGERLRIHHHPVGTQLGHLYNLAAMDSRGQALAFLLEGDRYLAHHVERMAAQLLIGNYQAVHGDRVLLSEAAVVGPDIKPGSLEATGGSISTLVARRDFLMSVGPMDIEGPPPGSGNAQSPVDCTVRYLMQIASTGELHHVHEATVESDRPLPKGAEVLDAARAALRLAPLELLRDLMAAHIREVGLRARLAELESTVGEAKS